MKRGGGERESGPQTSISVTLPSSQLHMLHSEARGGALEQL